MNNFFSFRYFFTPRPNPDFHFTKITLGVVILLMLVSLGIYIYRKKYIKDAIVKKMIKKYPYQLFTIAALLLFLLIVREAGVPFLSMRFLWAVLTIFLVVWIIKIIFTFGKEYQERTKKTNTESGINKYLPKKKKRK